MPITLKRTIWPVGHGAFYTEQFFDENNNPIWTAVYDCGSEQPNMLEHAIDEMFPKLSGGRKHYINALFISHFHSDHVNGLEYLLSRCSVNTLVLPQLTSNYMADTLAACALDENRAIADIVYGLYTGTSHIAERIVEVPSNLDWNQDGQILVVPQTAKDIQSRHHEVWDKADFINPKICDGNWIYLPFNLYSASKELKDAFAEDGKFMDSATKQISISKIYDELSQGKWKDLQDIYKTAFPKGHNEYSMPVFSGEQVLTRSWRKVSTYDICRRRILWILSDLYYNKFYEIGEDLHTNPNCIYTGDFLAKYVPPMIAFYNVHKVWDNTRLLQIPHHGSYGNYCDDLYDFPKVTFLSAAINDRYNHPHVKTLQAIADKCCLIYPVLDSPSTMLYQRYVCIKK